ncbi:energy transducer TonB [Acidobacterium sp. S8]|uniref:energy transducer TonB n=1 Tax=Acidobacterium sp. S8 TaxID=1641854 RepID=UPI0020B1654E|nr:energy transducer TonB [Acidobacterium sp. S8]
MNPPPLPTDPTERLQLGWELNGLQDTNRQPWHLTASYQIFDSDGKSKDQGTFEEWWVSERDYKLVYHGSEFSQEEYGTDHGIFHSGAPGWPLDPLRLLRSAILQPVPSPEDIQDLDKQDLIRKFGTTELTCSALSRHGEKADEDSISYCFDPKKPVLLYSNTRSLVRQTLFSHFFQFQGRYIPRDIQLYFQARPSLTIHIDTLEPLSEASQLTTAVPADAIPVTKRISLSQVQSLSDTGRQIKKVAPKYPMEAKEAHIQGTVIFDATISREGHIQSLRVLSGPLMLQQAALDAVRQWVYKPYLLNGEPVEVDTEAYVIFSLGSR